MSYIFSGFVYKLSIWTPSLFDCLPVASLEFKNANVRLSVSFHDNDLPKLQWILNVFNSYGRADKLTETRNTDCKSWHLKEMLTATI